MSKIKNSVGINIQITVKYIIYVLVCIAVISVIMIIPNPLIKIEVDNDWIGFYGGLLGAMIGGFVTYKGVELSINHSNNQIEKLEYEKSKEAILSIKPYLQVSAKIVSCPSSYSIGNLDRTINFNGVDNLISTIKNSISHVKYEPYVIKVKFKNIGRDSACNLKLPAYKFKSDEIINAFCINSSLTKSEETTELLYFVENINKRNELSLNVNFHDLNGNYYSQEHFIMFDNSANNSLAVYDVLSLPVKIEAEPIEDEQI